MITNTQNNTVKAYYVSNLTFAYMLTVIVVSFVLATIALSNKNITDSPQSTVSIDILYPGASPKKIKETILTKVENAIYKLPRIESVVSHAHFNSAKVEIKGKVSLETLLNNIQHSMGAIDDFPSGLKSYTVNPLENYVPLMEIVIASNQNLAKLSQTSAQVKSELLKIEGVSRVSVMLPESKVESLSIYSKLSDQNAIRITIETLNGENTLQSIGALHKYIDKKNSELSDAKLELLINYIDSSEVDYNNLISNIFMGFALAILFVSIFTGLNHSLAIALSLLVAFITFHSLLPSTSSYLIAFSFFLIMGLVTYELTTFKYVPYTNREFSNNKTLIFRVAIISSLIAIPNTIIAENMFSEFCVFVISILLAYFTIYLLVTKLSFIFDPLYRLGIPLPKKGISEPKNSLTRLKILFEGIMRLFIKKQWVVILALSSTALVAMAEFNHKGNEKVGDILTLSDHTLVSIEVNSDVSSARTQQIFDFASRNLLNINHKMQEKLGYSLIKDVYLYAEHKGKAKAIISLTNNAYQSNEIYEIYEKWQRNLLAVPNVKSISIDENSHNRGINNYFQYEFYGANANQLNTVTEEFANKVNDFATIVSLLDSSNHKYGTLSVELLPEAFKLGINQQYLISQVKNAYKELEVKNFVHTSNKQQIIMQFPPGETRPVVELQYTLIPTPEGYNVLLGDIAKLSLTHTEPVSQKTNPTQALYIRGYLKSGNVKANDAMDNIRREVLAELKSKYPGVTIKATEKLQEGHVGTDYKQLALIVISFLSIYILLLTKLNSYYQSLITSLTIPLNLIGVISLFSILGLPMSQISLLGFVTASAIGLYSSVSILNKANDNSTCNEIAVSAIFKAINANLKAILTTSISIILSLVPMTLNIDSPEIRELAITLSVTTIVSVITNVYIFALCIHPRREFETS